MFSCVRNELQYIERYLDSESERGLYLLKTGNLAITGPSQSQGTLHSSLTATSLQMFASAESQEVIASWRICLEENHTQFKRPLPTYSPIFQMHYADQHEPVCQLPSPRHKAIPSLMSWFLIRAWLDSRWEPCRADVCPFPGFHSFESLQRAHSQEPTYIKANDNLSPSRNREGEWVIESERLEEE